MADELNFHVEDFDHPPSDLTTDLLPPLPSLIEPDDDAASLSSAEIQARLQRLASVLAERRRLRNTLRHSSSNQPASTSRPDITRPRSWHLPPLASQRRMRSALTQLAEERSYAAGQPFDSSMPHTSTLTAAEWHRLRMARSMRRSRGDGTNDDSVSTNTAADSWSRQRHLLHNMPRIPQQRHGLGHRRSDEARRTISALMNGSTDEPAWSSDRRQAASTGNSLSDIRSILDNQQPGPSRATRPFIPDENSSEQGRHKRRRIDISREPERVKRITYGVEGQVRAGKLNMEIDSCDGSECVLPFAKDGNCFGVDNILLDDASVYSPSAPRANIVLNHYGETIFHLEKMIIRTPQHGISNALQEGMLFASLVKDEAFEDTSEYQIFNYSESVFPYLEKQAPDSRRYSHTAAGRQNYINPAKRFAPNSIDNAPELQDRGTTWQGDEQDRKSIPTTRFEIHDVATSIFGPTWDPSIESAEHDYLASGPHTSISYQSDGSGAPAHLDANSLPYLERQNSSADQLHRFLRDPLHADTAAEMTRRGELAQAERRAGRNTYDPITRFTNRVRRHLHGPPTPASPPDPFLQPPPTLSLAAPDTWDSPPDANSDTENDTHPRLPPLSANADLLTSFERSTSHLHSPSSRSSDREAHAKTYLVPNARFLMAKATTKNECVIEFHPPLAARYLLLKLWSSPEEDGMVDVQGIECFGYSGLRYFPAVKTV